MQLGRRRCLACLCSFTSPLDVAGVDLRGGEEICKPYHRQCSQHMQDRLTEGEAVDHSSSAGCMSMYCTYVRSYMVTK